jgi:hypothetical protein
MVYHIYITHYKVTFILGKMLHSSLYTYVHRVLKFIF